MYVCVYICMHMQRLYYAFQFSDFLCWERILIFLPTVVNTIPLLSFFLAKCVGIISSEVGAHCTGLFFCQCSLFIAAVQAVFMQSLETLPNVPLASHLHMTTSRNPFLCTFASQCLYQYQASTGSTCAVSVPKTIPPRLFRWHP